MRGKFHGFLQLSTSDYTVYTRSWKPDTTDHQLGLENFTGWIAGINSGCPDIPTGGSYFLSTSASWWQ